MSDNKPWNDFMLKEYEEAWAYIRYTYDISNRMLWYMFGIIIVIGAVAGKLLLIGETPGLMQANTGADLLNPKSMDPGRAYLLGFIFLILFLGGLFIHAFITFQRVIIDRQTKVIDGIRNYFIAQAAPEVDITPFLHFKKISIHRGHVDLIAQTRLMLPVFVNAATGTLSFMCFFRGDWQEFLWFLIPFLSLIAIQFLLVNQVLYRMCASRLELDK